ncbi:BTAD domain-containing putative transcriptional regulator [Phytomonospora sp. NPDC050363]|uniref:AfsR/SARP family transcriptional regulator n=1 Tax=Phytomonospora sp. NPDC050363 TaxID=3155642 RepID=UPI0033D32555
MDVEFRVLGAAEIVVDGQRAALTGKRTRGLLSALLLNEGRVVQSGELIALVWGTAPPKTAANQLQIAVHRLRSALSDAGLDGRLRTADGGYVLDLPAHARVDIRVFRELAATATGRAAAGEWPAALATGRAALAVWRGHAWDGLDTGTARRHADTAAAEHIAVVELTQAAEVVLGDRAAPVAELRRLTAEHPYHQRFWYLLILALAVRGRPAEALEAHLAARELHQRELGTALGPELGDLERAILRGDLQPAVDAVRAWTFGRAEPAAVPPSPGRLPAELGDFIGRDAEAEHVAGILRGNPDHRDPATIVIAGLGGIGKTSFAVRTAHRHAGLFADGGFFVDLRGFDDEPKDPHAVMGDLLHALGVAGQAVPDDPDARLGVYRSVMAGRRVLLVLDNAASEAQVRPLLPVNAASAALVTSRRLLAGLDGAFVVELDVLTPPEAAGLLAGIRRTGGPATDPAALDRLADLAGRHPLALRILGARAARMSGGELGALLARLGDERARLDELADDDGQVRSSIDHSYRDLGERAARLLRLAALLPTPRFGAEAAAALLETDLFEAEGVLDELLDAQLLRPAEAAEGLGLRYVMHDLVRLYARERAREDAGDGGEALGRAYELMLVLAHHADDALGYRYYPSPELPGWAPKPEESSLAAVGGNPRGWFAEERELLLGIIARAGGELAWRVTCTLVNHLDLSGSAHDAIALLEGALGRVEDAGARAFLDLARSRSSRAHRHEATALLSAGRARRHFLARGDLLRAAAAAVQLAESARLCHHHWAVRATSDWALATLASLPQDDPAVLAQTGWALKERGVFEYFAAGAEAARSWFVRAAPVMRAGGDLCGEGRALGALAIVEMRDDEWRAAGIRRGTQAAGILGLVGDRPEELFMLVSLAEGLTLDGRAEEAHGIIVEALAGTRRLRQPQRTMTALLTLGQTLRAMGRPHEAIAPLNEAVAVTTEIGYLRTRGGIRCELARAALDLGRVESAAGIARKAAADGADVAELLARIAAVGGNP